MQISPEVLATVQQVVAEVLAVEFDELGPKTFFFSELDGESIDLLEIRFRLEKQYGIRLQLLELKSDEFQLDEQGRLTSESIARLKTRFPFLQLDGVAARPLERRGDFLTVEMIASFVQAALDEDRAPAGVAEGS